MKQAIKPIFFTLISLTSISAIAGQPDALAVTSSFYLAAGLGVGGMNTQNQDLEKMPASPMWGDSYHRRHESPWGLAWQVNGGYLFKINDRLLLGPELGYTGYHSNSYEAYDSFPSSTGVSDYKLKYSGYNLSLLAVAKYYFHRFNLLGKAGIAYVNQTATASNDYVSAAGLSKSKLTKGAVKPEIAIGLGYDFTPQLGFALTYYHIFGNTPSFKINNGATPGDNGVNKIASVNVALLTIIYKFV